MPLSTMSDKEPTSTHQWIMSGAGRHSYGAEARNQPNAYKHGAEQEEWSEDTNGSEEDWDPDPDPEEDPYWYGTAPSDWPSSSGALRLADFEDSIHAPHILAPKAFLLAKERAVVEDLHSGISYRARRRVPVQPKWTVQRRDYNAWRKHTLDNQPGSIYTMDEDVLKSPSDVSLSLSSSILGASGESLHRLPSPQQNVERQYIQHASGGRVAEAKAPENIRFTLHIMRKYNKPVREDRDSSYGAPAVGAGSKLRPEKSIVSKIVDGVVRPPSSIKLVHSHVRPMHFQNPSASAFCEVLGPSSCRDCIEGTNRYTAHGVENHFFPDIPQYTGTALLLPKPGHIAARENRRLSLKASQEKGIQEFDPDSRSKSRERSITLAIRKTSNKVQNSKKKASNAEKGIILPIISQGMPTLAANKRGKLQLRLYDRRWEARAKDFFSDEEGKQKLDRQDSSLHLSEQQKRLRQMLENAKYKSAVRGVPTQQYKSKLQ